MGPHSSLRSTCTLTLTGGSNPPTEGLIMELAIAEESLPVLSRLRRDDCIKLMKAHDIQIPVFERKGRTIPPTKEQIKHIIQTHMDMGTFKKKPKFPEQLLSVGERVKLKQADYYIKFRGPKGGRWCIMKGEDILAKGFTTEAAAQEGMDNGVHIPTSGKQDA